MTGPAAVAGPAVVTGLSISGLQVTRGDVWTVVLDRPERANALSAQLVEGLHAVLDQAHEARPQALVLRGSARHFSAGFDLEGLALETDATLALRFLRIGLLLERLLCAPYVTAAVAEGAAVGAGADLVLACDHRLVDPAVTLRFPGSAFGVVLGAARRHELGDAAQRGGGTTHHVTGVPSSLGAALALPPPTRTPHDADAALAALARSVIVPGLRDRIAAYAGHTLRQEHA